MSSTSPSPAMADAPSLGAFLDPAMAKATHEDWEAAVAKALKGGTLDGIAARTAEGIVVPPLSAPRRDAVAIAGRPAGTPWTIVQRLVVGPDAAAANAAALDELNGGVGALDIVLSASALPDPARLFEGVYTDLIDIHLAGIAPGAPARAEIANFLAGRRGDSAGTLHLGIDPYAPGQMAAEPAAAVSDAIALGLSAGLPGTWLTTAGQGWHGTGATSAQQLAAALATTAEYLRAGESEGSVDPETLFRRIEFRIVADQNQFLTIARLRAFRRLHALFAEACGFRPSAAFVHAEGARRMLTRRDPWVNILRSTIAAFSAAIGGADSIGTLPHTAVLGLPDDDARRLSRNVQTVLLEESNLHKVADPAAGSGGIEALTDALAEAAWAEFQQIEREGGLAASLAAGALPGRVGDAAAASRKAVARRREPISGTSTWPLLTERTAVVAGPLPEQPATAGPIQPYRIAEPWEALRDASDAMLAETGARPLVYLANLGPIAAFIARNNWAKNLFEAGGIETAGREAHLSADSVGPGFAASGARIACLCSNDATYAELAIPAAKALKAAGADLVLIAGRAGDSEAALRAAGVDRFVHEGLDMIALLTDLAGRLGADAATGA